MSNELELICVSCDSHLNTKVSSMLFIQFNLGYDIVIYTKISSDSFFQKSRVTVVQNLVWQFHTIILSIMR